MDRIVQEVLFTDSECDILLNNATEFNETKLTTKAPDGQLNYNYVDKSHRNSTEGKYDLTPELKKMITDKCSKYGVIGLGPKARIQGMKQVNTLENTVTKQNTHIKIELKHLLYNYLTQMTMKVVI